ncbi:MAG: glycosyltransferase family 2 protein [Candidatus Aenigmatarchaeota archaeon]
MKISIVVPCYNEEKIISDTYKEIKKEIERISQKEDYEIIFANDGSTDNTGEILKGISKKDDRVRVISWFPNKGVGYAYRRLYKISSGGIVIEMDADLSIKPEIIQSLINEIKVADVVIASKYLGTSNKVPFLRKVSSRIFYFASKILFGIKVKDIGSGFAVFKRNVLESIELESDGFEIYIETLAKIQRKGFKMKEIPAKYVHRENSRLSLLRHGPKTLFKTFLLWLKLRKIRL